MSRRRLRGRAGCLTAPGLSGDAPVMAIRRTRSSKARINTTALSYKNRMGDTCYLHEGKTKTGKPRFFVAKTVRMEALAVMPEGYEFSESINGVVSVRRVDTSAPQIPERDLDLVRTELAHQDHLRLPQAVDTGGGPALCRPGADRRVRVSIGSVRRVPVLPVVHGRLVQWSHSGGRHPDQGTFIQRVLSVRALRQGGQLPRRPAAGRDHGQRRRRVLRRHPDRSHLGQGRQVSRWVAGVGADRPERRLHRAGDHRRDL